MLKEYLTTLANKLRSVLETTEKINAQNFVDKIQDVYSKGYTEGDFSGYQSGYENGFREGTWEGIEQGKQEGKQEGIAQLWEAIQGGGAQTYDGNNQGTFSNMNFSKNTFKPNYDIKPTNAYKMFWNCPTNAFAQTNEFEQIDMAELEAEMGIVFDFSKCTKMQFTFTGGLFHTLNVIDLSSVDPSSDGYYMNYAFFGGYATYCNQIHRINRLIVAEKTRFSTNSFSNSGLLEHIGFEGVLATNNLNLKDAILLDKSSIKSLFNILSTTTSGLSITLSLTAVKKAFETSSGANDGNTSEEWLNLIATKSNWTINLV